jgi:hypothetical protein
VWSLFGRHCCVVGENPFDDETEEKAGARTRESCSELARRPPHQNTNHEYFCLGIGFYISSFWNSRKETHGKSEQIQPPQTVWKSRK